MIETKASCADIRVIAIRIFIFGFVSSFDIQILNFRISGGSQSPPPSERHHIHQSGINAPVISQFLSVLHKAAKRITINLYDHHHLQDLRKTEWPVGSVGPASPCLKIGDSARGFGEQDQGVGKIGGAVRLRPRQASVRKPARAERSLHESQAHEGIW